MSEQSIKILESKMHLPWYNFTVRALLCVLIPTLGFLCRNLTTPDLPLAFSVLWAPAGISLAFILLFGFRVWPEVFIGNFIYNLLNVGQTDRSFWFMLGDSTAISLGSLLQAVLAGSIMKKLSTPTYFNTVRDVFIFLIPAGLLSCMIASSFATVAIYMNDDISVEGMLRTWMTFWLGDSLGVYVFTPLIVVLMTQDLPSYVFKGTLEPVLMILGVAVISWLSFFMSYPLPQLLIPFSIWITYRFRMYGAVISTFIIALSAIIPATIGKGVFVSVLSENPLLYLVTFIGVIIGTNLVVAALVNERIEAWKKLEAYSGGLQKHLENKTVELWEAHEEIFLKEKLASIGMMMSGIGRELSKPLTSLNSHLSAVTDSLKYFDKVYSEEKGNLRQEIATSLENNLEGLKQNLKLINQDQDKVNKIVEMIVKESKLSDVHAPRVKSINLHILLNRCLSQSLSEIKTKFPKLDVIVVKEYDKYVEMIEGLPEDLTHAFVNLFENAFYSVAKNENRSSSKFIPKVVVKTMNKQDSALITIWDNGGGLSEAKKANFFEPFLSDQGEFSGSGLSLAMTHDIIVQEHHGHISIDSDGVNAQQITIELPKFIHKKIT